mgnify:CR=1 FL=1
MVKKVKQPKQAKPDEPKAAAIPVNPEVVPPQPASKASEPEPVAEEPSKSDMTAF